MLHCHMAQSLPVGLARFLLAAQLAQSLPMGLCRAMRDCVLVLGLNPMRRDGGGWWRMVADGGGWWRMVANGGVLGDSQIVIWPKK
jgi:hypothetical protein